MLTRKLIPGGVYAYDSDGDGAYDKYAACRAATGKPEDEGRGCKATFIVDAATGIKEAVLTAPNPLDEMDSATRAPMRETAPVVADLDGDGQVEIVSGGDVYRYDGSQWNLAWQAAYSAATRFYEPVSVSVADLDGDGKAEVILQVEFDKDGQRNRGFAIYAHDGTLQHAFTYPSRDAGMPTIADVDGDGVPEIVFAARGIVYAYHADGTLLWANAIPDDDGTLPGDPPAWSPGNPSGLAYWPKPVSERSDPGSSVQVYDLDLDGAPEVIVNGIHRLAIIDGRTGAIKSSVHSNAGSSNRAVPLVVDADGDGRAEILLAAGNPQICAGCPSVNIFPFAGEHRDWAPAPLVFNQASYNPWAIDDSGAIRYDGTVHRSFRTQRQLGTVTDPRTRDTATFTYAASDAGGTSAPATVSIRMVPPNQPPVITSIPPAAVSNATGPYPLLVYTITAYDPDQGDTVRYELVYSSIDTSSFDQAQIDPVTGRMYMALHGDSRDIGNNVFIVAAVDSAGARATQAFMLDVNPYTRSVPSVVGQDVEPAKAAITAAQLTPRVVEVVDARPIGQVIAQDPAGGTMLVRNGTVLLSVSKGPQPVTMPDVVGKTLTTANAQLAALGFTVDVTSAASATVPAGTVMAQSPPAGTEVVPTPEHPAALTVSSGTPLPAPIASIKLVPGNVTRIATEEIAYRALATLTDGTGADVTLKATWTSSASAVASISPAGIAKAIAAGTTGIRATVGSAHGDATLTVVPRTTVDTTPPVAQITAPGGEQPCRRGDGHRHGHRRQLRALRACLVHGWQRHLDHARRGHLPRDQWRARHLRSHDARQRHVHAPAHRV